MFSFKLYYLFKSKIRRIQLYDIIVIISCSFIMPFLLRLVPLVDYLSWPILILYFLGAGSSRILVIPILLMTNSSIARIANLMYLKNNLGLSVLIKCKILRKILCLLCGWILLDFF